MRALLILLILIASPAHALNEKLQCVPYARALTGVSIYGDAHTWWGQAKGRYHRGSRPKVGAIMAFRPHGAMRLGHIAAVRQIVDSRTLIISHANWSTIGGRRGHIEENIRVVDASENNDWSRVRVWYTPNNAMGGTRWPLNGFIYPKVRRGDGQARIALASLIGPKARLSPIPRGRSEIRVASRASAKTPAATFNLSSKVFADIDRQSAAEARAAKASQDMDAIGDLIGSLGS